MRLRIQTHWSVRRSGQYGRAAMTARSNRPTLGFALAVAILALPIGVGPAPAAEQPSAQDIIDALKAPRMTRGLTTSPAGAARAAEDSKFVHTLRNRTTRSLTTEEREKIASIANSKPKIDLEINFEFNSATIAAKALPQVTALGEALTSPDLKGPHLHRRWAHRCQR